MNSIENEWTTVKNKKYNKRFYMNTPVSTPEPERKNTSWADDEEDIDFSKDISKQLK